MKPNIENTIEEKIKKIVSGKDYDTIKESITRMYVSGSIPSDMTGDYPKLARILKFLLKFGLDETFIGGVFFTGTKMSVSSGFALLLALRSKAISKIDEYFFDKNSIRISEVNKNLSHDPVGAICEIVTKDGLTFTRIFRLADAERAKLIGSKRFSTWNTYPNDMLMHKARLRAINSAFPEQMAGVNIYEEKEGIIEDEAETLDNPKKVILEKKTKPPVSSDVNLDDLAQTVINSTKEESPVTEKKEVVEKKKVEVIDKKISGIDYIIKDTKVSEKLRDFLRLNDQEKKEHSETAISIFRLAEKQAKEYKIIGEDVTITDKDLLASFPVRFENYLKRIGELTEQYINKNKELL